MPVYGISGFKNMQVFVLANCLLSGIIPPWLQSLQSLNVLDISWNKFNGNIPPWLGNLNNLFYIDLSNNSFSGQLPESFTRMRSLISIDGSSEQSFPLFIKNNSTDKGLQYNQVSSFPPSLILSNNLLVGSVLSGFGHLVKLHVLDLSWNKFSGPIPEELSNMANLEVLNLAYNDLNGTIPSSLTKLNFLSKFDVSYNNLTGDIPTGGQFSTFTNEDFVGNSALCPLRNSSCHEMLESGNEQRHDTVTEMQITYIMVEVGFASGLLMVWSTLFFTRAWRAAYFQIIDRFFDTLCALTMVKGIILRINRRNEVHH
uniref:Uncharacterized protein n=1 Tax=Arundo donax TaxID=35708 RepID=A0A0A9FI49_ARUDO